jgi:hypothetical protein
MKIIGWIFGIWLVGSIPYSLAFTARGVTGMKMNGDPLGMAGTWGRRMLTMQVVKGIIAFFIFKWLLS